MIEGNRAIDVSRWLSSKDEAFLAGIVTVACDLHGGYRSGRHPNLSRRSLIRRQAQATSAPLEPDLRVAVPIGGSRSL